MSHSQGTSHVTSIGPWLLGNTLGEGNYGKVKEARNRVTGVKAAVKMIDLNRVAQSARGRMKIDKEIEILKLLKHPNIIELYDVIETQQKVYIIMELATGGELFDYILKKGYLREKEARPFIRQLLSGLEYCHAHLVIHRDLKLENLLLDVNGNIKLSDFGLSNFVVPGQLLQTSCGSPQYCAPEIIAGGGYIGPSSDVWGLGVILFTLVCGYLPFSLVAGDDFARLLAAAKSENYQIEPHVSYECADLISRMLDPNPDTRITLQHCREHPWVNMGYSSLPPCLLDKAHEKVDPPDPDIIAQLSYFGFKPVEAIKKLAANKPCQEVAMYHLLASRKQAEVKKLAKPRVAHLPGAQRRTRSSSFQSSENPFIPRRVSEASHKAIAIDTAAMDKLSASAPNSPPNSFTKVVRLRLPLFDGNSSPVLPSPSLSPPSTSSTSSSPTSPPSDLPGRRASTPMPLPQDHFSLSPAATPQRSKHTTKSTPCSATGSRTSSPKSRRRNASPGPIRPRSNSITSALSFSSKSLGVGKFFSKKRGSTPVRQRGSRRMSTSVSKSMTTTSAVLNADVTSPKPPDIIMDEIQGHLQKSGITFKRKKHHFKCKYDDKNSFKIEVCRVKGMNLHGVRCCRFKGDIWVMAEVCRKVLGGLKLED